MTWMALRVLIAVSMARTVAGFVSVLPASFPLRSSSLVMQTAHYDYGEYPAQHDYGFHQDYSAPQQFRPPIRWTIVGFCGVTAYSGVAGLPGEHKSRFWTPEPEPYTLERSGEAQTLGRWNMFEQKLTVSRMQARIQVSDDGIASVESLGRGPTLWRERGMGPWIALYRGDVCPLGDGDQISLDCNNPEGAVFACFMEHSGYQQLGGYSHGFDQQAGYDQQQHGYHGQHHGGYGNYDDNYRQQDNNYGQQYGGYGQPQGDYGGQYSGNY